VQIRAWKHEVSGVDGFVVPVYLLDTDLPENTDWDRHLTHHLYGGDAWYRLCQEAVLGIGGVRMLRALGHSKLQRFHMNEGHASLLTLELLFEEARSGTPVVQFRRRGSRPASASSPHTQCCRPTTSRWKWCLGKKRFRPTRNVLCADPASYDPESPGILACPVNALRGDILNMTYLA
jgi:hypothetical protein